MEEKSMGEKKRILVIDDDEFVRDTIKGILELSFNVEVSLAKNGSEGLEIFDGFDLVFCDMVMPIMDGLEFLKRAKKINPHVKVIIVSGYHGDAEHKELEDAGAVDFVEKPFTIEEIKKKTREFL